MFEFIQTQIIIKTDLIQFRFIFMKYFFYIN